MNKNDIQRAFENIRPDEAAKSRMLEQILFPSEISPVGKDERKMRRKMKPMVIAAIIGLMVMLMGSAVIALSLHDMKIGEISSKGRVLDSEGNIVKESEISANEIISLHGFYGSPTYLAHQEWYQFKEEYEDRHTITEEENSFRRPEAYEAYGVYNQELMDKVDEIAEKYDLKLLGAFAPFQKWERKVFYEACGIESLLTPESNATIEKESGYFYEAGNFKIEFTMTMNGEGKWSHRMYSTMYYSNTDCFDTVYFVISASEDWNQWNYITADGTEILLAQAKSGYGACMFCFRGDAVIYVALDGYHQSDDGETTFMTGRQLEQVADQIDFGVQVGAVDMDLAREKLGKFQNQG